MESYHYSEVIMSTLAFQTTGVSIVYSTVCSGVDQRKHQSSASLAICAGNSQVAGEFPAQRPVTRSFDVFFICAWINVWVNKRLAGDLRRQHAHFDVNVMFCDIVNFLTRTDFQQSPALESYDKNNTRFATYNTIAHSCENFKLLLSPKQ